MSVGFGVGCLFVIFGGYVSDKILEKRREENELISSRNCNQDFTVSKQSMRRVESYPSASPSPFTTSPKASQSESASPQAT